MKRTARRAPRARGARGAARRGAALRSSSRRARAPVAAAAEALIACLESGGTVYFCGNGGSAADAQHLAAEFAGRYLVDRPALAAVALTTNSSAVTAIGNDYGYEEVFSRQLEGLGDARRRAGRDHHQRRLGERPARGRERARPGHDRDRHDRREGRGASPRCATSRWSRPSESTPHIQEGHITMGHAFCELVERAMFPVERAAPARAPGGARDRGAAAGEARP